MDEPMAPDTAEWQAMVDRAVAWMRAHPSGGLHQLITTLNDAPESHAFVQYLLASPWQDERRRFEHAVLAALGTPVRTAPAWARDV